MSTQPEGSPFNATATLLVHAYRRAPATTGWYPQGAWTRQDRLHAIDCWTWFDWWRRADLPVFKQEGSL